MLPLARMARLFSIFLISMMTLAAQVEDAAVESQMKVRGKIVDIGSDLIVIDTLTTCERDICLRLMRPPTG
jgi:hypothetical protein